MLAIDHVILVVDDLGRAAARLFDEHGLGSVAGGRHEGHGTGNRIIPLGSDYLELMSAVDEPEAATSPLGRWVLARVAPDPLPAAVCIRTTDATAEAARLGLGTEPMARVRTDGVRLAWDLVGLEQALGPERLPFFIEWHTPEHPAATPVEHRGTRAGIAWVEVGGDPAILGERLGDHDLPIRTVGGKPGLRRVAIATDGDDIVL